MDNHNRAVASISSQVGSFHSRKEPFRIYHGSTNSTRASQIEISKMVDTSSLSHILSINTSTKTALVEPNIPMDLLISHALSHNLIPPIVPEFPGITVGGGFAGTAGESSSFRYGFFDRTINWIEMVLGNGDIIKASPTENSDLFYGAASSFGTLGVTTLLEIQLIPAKTYVALTYITVSSIEEALLELEKGIKDPETDYLDGIMFSTTYGVICSGRLTNDLPKNQEPQTFHRPHDPWFYLHVQSLTKHHPSSIPITEYIPLASYLFRYDRGGFWVARYAFRYFLTPFNRITRFLLNPFMNTRTMYAALHESGLSSKYIIQDVAIPWKNSSHFMAYLDATFTQYPIWLCPLKVAKSETTHSPHSILPNTQKSDQEIETDEKEKEEEKDFLLNFGIWGPPPITLSPSQFIQYNRSLEKKVTSLSGLKWLYAHTYYTESEFDEIYPREPYDELRKKWHADYLPSVWEKVRVDCEGESWWEWVWGVWPIAGLWGVWRAARGSEYLLKRRERGGKGVVKED